MPTKETWCYDYQTLMRLTGQSRNTLAQHRVRRKFDPADLRSVVIYLSKNGTLELRHEIFCSLFAKGPPVNPPTKRRRKKRM